MCNTVQHIQVHILLLIICYKDSQPPSRTTTTTTTTTTSTFKNQQTVLLQTARAMAYSDIDGSSAPVRVFDSASQLSYITDKTANLVSAQDNQNRDTPSEYLWYL